MYGIAEPCCKEPVRNLGQGVSFLPHSLKGWWCTNDCFHTLRPRRLPAPPYLELGLGGALLADLELAIRTFVDVPVRPTVAHAAGPGDEVGI